MRFVLKWIGIVVGIAILSVIGFGFAAYLSPGDPSRSYRIAALVLLGLTLAWRLWMQFRERGL